MDQRKKKILLFIGSLFVAVIFLTSYASFGNSGTATSSTTTMGNVHTFFVSGSSNAIITGYKAPVHVRINSNSSTADAQVLKTLSKLESNGSINYFGSNKSYEVYVSTIDAYSLQGLLLSVVNQSGAIAVTANASVELPLNITLYSTSSYPIRVNLNDRNSSIDMTGGLRGVGSMINVSVSAIVTSDGSIFNNQLSVSLKR
jgi:hypothetical protein